MSAYGSVVTDHRSSSVARETALDEIIMNATININKIFFRIF